MPRGWFSSYVHVLVFLFHASAKGYKFMRKVIVADGTFLNRKYKGVLLNAMTHEGSTIIYPLAFGIADSKNDISWEWIFTNLTYVVSVDPSLVVVSDIRYPFLRSWKGVPIVSS